MRRKGIFLVLSRASSPEAEAEFDRWYEKVHMPDSLLLPGFVTARRFHIADEQLLPDRAAADFDYVTVFEVDDLDLVADARALLPRLEGVSSQFLSEAMDRDTLRAWVCEQVAEVADPSPLPEGVTSLAEVAAPDAPLSARGSGEVPPGAR